MDPEERVLFDAWQEEICREGEEAERVLKPYLQKYLPKDALVVLAGPCPDTPTFVAYQEGRLSPLEADEITTRHVVFCRSCLEELEILRRADEVEYEFST